MYIYSVYKYVRLYTRILCMERKENASECKAFYVILL